MIEQTKWKRVENSRRQILKVGKSIRDLRWDGMVSDTERNEAIEVIDNWRMAYAFPLIFDNYMKNSIVK